jgi:hypothetical protein
MTIKTSGALSISDIKAEFGGDATPSLSEYYSGGGRVPAGTVGYPGGVATTIPTSGQISISNFYGADNNPYEIAVVGKQSLTYIDQTTTVIGANTYYIYHYTFPVPNFTGRAGRRVHVSCQHFASNEWQTTYYAPWVRLGSATNNASTLFDLGVEHWGEGYRQSFLMDTLTDSQTVCHMYVAVIGEDWGITMPALSTTQVADVFAPVVIQTVGTTSFSTQVSTAGYGTYLNINVTAPAGKAANSFVMVNAINNFDDGTGSYLLSSNNLDYRIGRASAYGYDLQMSADSLTYSTLSGKQSYLAGVRFTWSK